VGIDRLRVVLAWLIVGAWVATIVYAAVDRTYQPPPTVHLLMMAVAAFLFGPSITGRDRD
jgi:uncharacterized membrane protein AbrB (regulator of aidB expression)